MDPSTLTAHADPAHAFVVEVLRTGLMLTDLVADLLESVPPEAFPGEDPGDVLFEMLAGSLRPAVVAAGPETLEECSALLGAIRDRTVEDLEEAARRARQHEQHGRGRARRRR